LHATFKLSAGGEDVAIFAADGLTLLDGFSFGQQQTDVSLAFLPDTTGMKFLMDPSPGERNRPQPGHTRNYNALDPTQNQIIDFDPLHALEIGYTFGTKTSNAPPSQQGYILFATGVDSVQMGADGTLLLSPSPTMTQFFNTDAAGNGYWSATVPNLPTLVGFSVYFQSYVVSGGFSNGIVATVGEQGISGPTDP
ncbi:MAG: hypothetical protein KDB53_16450, partial [Planctomycetes bacterium]|nr:hypothetical protein [Planctomycetota bacterium]